MRTVSLEKVVPWIPESIVENSIDSCRFTAGHQRSFTMHSSLNHTESHKSHAIFLVTIGRRQERRAVSEVAIMLVIRGMHTTFKAVRSSATDQRPFTLKLVHYLQVRGTE